MTPADRSHPVAPWLALVLALGLALGLSGCGQEELAAKPPPQEVSGEVTGYYCHMLLTEHGGPKGQIHLRSRDEPIFFSSVRDAVAFTRLEEEPKDIVAIYVNDMGRATDWEQPEPGSWVDAHEAWFVLNSRRMGGMGLPEAVPFGSESTARDFAAANGGELVRLADIPVDYVLGLPEPAGPEAAADADEDAPDGHDLH